MSATGGDRRLWLLGLGGAWAAGAALRFWNLRAQVMGGDELHALRQAVSVPAGKILFRHTDFDHGRPLTALFRLAMDAGVVFDELVFRLPVLACGLLLMVLLPLLVRRPLGRGTALLLAWLVALSPVLVLYSRIVRTYVPVLLLAVLAVAGYWRWMRTGRPRHAVSYAVCAVLASFTHSLSAPFVLAPLGFSLGERLLFRRGPTLARQGLLAGATVGLTALLYAPLWKGIRRLASTRTGRGGFEPDTLWGTLGMQAGTALPVLVAVFWGLALVGAWRAARERPRLVAYALVLCAVQVAAILVLAPKQSDQPLVFNRYVLFCTPFVLAAVAFACAAPGRARGARLLGGAALVVALFLGGPLVRAEFRESSFVHHNRFVSFVAAAALPPVEPPAGYAHLGEHGAVLEFPWNSHWNRSVAPLAYQRSHGREVVVAGRGVTVDDPRLRLRNAVPLDGDPPAAFLASRARWLIVHADMGGEELRFHARDSLGPEREGMRQDGAAMARLLRRSWAPPAYQDEEVAIWDLETRRAARGAGAQRMGEDGR